MWRRRKDAGEPASDGDAPDAVIVESADRVGLRIPIEGTDGRVCGSLAMEWSRWDPLVVEMSVRASSGHAIVELAALRTDVRDALVTPGSFPGLSMGPAVTRGYSAIVFHEGGVTLPVIVPSAPLWELIRATERVVPMNDRAEARALDEAFAHIVRRADGGHRRMTWTS